MSSLPIELWQLVLVNVDLIGNLNFALTSKAMYNLTRREGFLHYEMSECQKLRKDSISSTQYKLLVIADTSNHDLATRYMSNLLVNRFIKTKYIVEDGVRKRNHIGGCLDIEHECLKIMHKYNREYENENTFDLCRISRLSAGNKHEYQYYICNDELEGYRKSVPVLSNCLAANFIDKLRESIINRSHRITSSILNEMYYVGLIETKTKALILESHVLDLLPQYNVVTSHVVDNLGRFGCLLFKVMRLKKATKEEYEAMYEIIKNFVPDKTEIQAFIDKLNDSHDKGKGFSAIKLYNMCISFGSACGKTKTERCDNILKQVKQRIKIDKDQFNF